MKHHKPPPTLFAHLLLALACCRLPQLSLAVTTQQFHQSLDMMRNGCMPKFKVPVEVLDVFRTGDVENVEVTPDLTCYTKCVAQLAGTVTKKGEFSIPKAIAQVPIILPPELQEPARNALAHCKDAQKSYKDSCEKVFYTVRCMALFDPPNFSFP